MYKEIKEFLKYFFRKNFGYDLRSIRVKLGKDFLDQKKILEKKTPKIIFDVGANVGQTTSKYKKIFPKAKIFGFEPFKEVFERYVNHFSGDKKVSGINLALSNKIGSAKFFVNNNCYTNSLLPIEKTELMKDFSTVREIEVVTETIDHFCDVNNIDYIDILKLDVQGGELLVLEGAREMLSKDSISLIYTEIEFVDLYQNQPLFEDIIKFLNIYKYKLYKEYNIESSQSGNPIAGDAIFINHSMAYNSQFGQDKFIDQEIFNQMTGGVFLELGADNGINGSNTLFFEQERGWTGLCVEPRNSAYQELVRNRKCQTANVAISKDKTTNKKFLEIDGELAQLSGVIDTFDPRHLERIQEETSQNNSSTAIIDVPNTTLNEVLEKSGISRIDYFSLDTEGGELDILKSIDFKRFSIICISVENKYEDKEVCRFLSSVGYRKMTRLKIDDIFVLKGSAFDRYHKPLKQQLLDRYDKFKKFIKKIIAYD